MLPAESGWRSVLLFLELGRASLFPAAQSSTNHSEPQTQQHSGQHQRNSAIPEQDSV